MKQKMANRTFLIVSLFLVFVHSGLVYADAEPFSTTPMVSEVSEGDIQEYRLLKFKVNVQNDPFHALLDWTSATPVCNWSNIICDDNYHVVELNLQDKLLRGTIAGEIVHLKYLKYINLQNNSFSGQIPGGFSYLAYLKELRLGLNPLEGSIPDDLWSLRNVSYINISGTNISGNLSPTVQNLTNISYLYLDNNKLGGSIPIELSNLKQLQILCINGNSFSGQFPLEIIYLPKISTLDISNNNFSGMIPEEKQNLNFSYRNNPSLTICKNCRLRSTPPPAILVLREASSNVPQASPAENSKHLSPFLSTVIGIVITAVFLVLCWMFIHYWKLWQHKGIVKATGAKVTVIEEASDKRLWTVYTRNFALNDLRRATRNFSPDFVIGSGGFGVVYKGVLNTCMIVAIKRARQESYQGAKEFQNEVELLSKIHHKHLVNLVGFCDEEDEQILVYEYVPNGSLLEHIAGQVELPLTWRQRVQTAIGAAKGIAYLHDGCNPAIIHRDIKPSNILLDCNYEAKVSDFGLSKTGPVGSATHVSTQVKGTPGYLDPHYYLSFHLSTTSDVYSFGVILLQLVSAKPAVDHSRKRSQYNIVNWARNSIEQGRLEDVLDPRLLAQPYNRDILLEMGKIGLRCVSKDLKDRPTMSMVGQELEVAIRKCEMPLLHQPSSVACEGSMDARRTSSKREKAPLLSKQADSYYEDRKDLAEVASVRNSLPLQPAFPFYGCLKGSKKMGSRRESVDKSLENSIGGLEKFHIELDSFSSINVRCFDSSEWEDYRD